MRTSNNIKAHPHRKRTRRPLGSWCLETFEIAFASTPWTGPMPRASEDARRKHANAECARRAAKKAVAAAASGHPKPNRRAPNGCVWDGRTEPAGVWRRRDTNEIYDPSAVAAATAARNAAHARKTDAARARHAAQQRVTAQRANQRVRRRKHMRARCNESLFKPGFKYEWVEQHDAGTLYDERSRQCCFCTRPFEVKGRRVSCVQGAWSCVRVASPGICDAGWPHRM